jgi:hypothetical protein
LAPVDAAPSAAAAEPPPAGSEGEAEEEEEPETPASIAFADSTIEPLPLEEAKHGVRLTFSVLGRRKERPT